VRLFIVRHGEAEPGEPDALRPLSAAGREQSRALAGRLPSLDAVLTSPLLRARETAAALARAAGVEPEVDERLAPGATAEDVRAVVAGRDGTIAVVGHQPDCGRIAAALTGGPEPNFPPAGICEVEL
jgi:phosphohistidine phosphatase